MAKKYSEVEINGKTMLKIWFDYDPELVQDIKANLKGRRWDPEDEVWLAPNIKANVTALEDLDFEKVDEGRMELGDDSEFFV